jgi:hypothetical protein
MFFTCTTVDLVTSLCPVKYSKYSKHFTQFFIRIFFLPQCKQLQLLEQTFLPRNEDVEESVCYIKVSF